MDPSRHMAVRELDLSSCHSTTIVDKINAVPGLKTSTAFFTFLRANLALNPSALSSQTNTPMLQPTLSAPAPSLVATDLPLLPLDDIPPLSLEVLKTNDDKTDALHLIADSIAQQRQRASLGLVCHPLCLAGLAILLAGSYHYCYVVSHDLGLLIMVGCGIIMSYLVAIRYFTSRYIQLAEQLQWSWLRADDGEEDTILGTRFGSQIIGTLVLRLEMSPGFSGKRRNRNSGLRGGKGVIRAWTTQLKYRGRGVGRDLLQEAIRLTREKCGKDAEIGFAKEHANSAMVLPELFNGFFRNAERAATKALDDLLSELDANKKKR